MRNKFTLTPLNKREKKTVTVRKTPHTYYPPRAINMGIDLEQIFSQQNYRTSVMLSGHPVVEGALPAVPLAFD